MWDKDMGFPMSPRYADSRNGARVFILSTFATMELTKFDYEGHTISFDFGDGHRMINATELIKAFPGKLIANFLRNRATKDYIVLLKSRYANSHNGEDRKVLRVVQGGNPELQGTWMDEKLALKFSSWLSPGFELWVYDRIHELLTTGKTEVETTPSQDIVQSIRLIADKLEAHDRDIQELKGDVTDIKDSMGELEAKILSIDENYYAISGYCAKFGIDCPLDKAKAWGLKATKASKAKGKDIGRAYDAKYGAVNTYHITILKEVVE